MKIKEAMAKKRRRVMKKEMKGAKGARKGMKKEMKKGMKKGMKKDDEAMRMVEWKWLVNWSRRQQRKWQ